MQAAAEGIVSIVATLFLSCGIGSNGRGQADVSGVTGGAIFETPPLPLPSPTPMLFPQQMIRAKVSQRVKRELFGPFGDVRFNPESGHSLRQCVLALSSRGASLFAVNWRSGLNHTLNRPRDFR